VELTLDDDGEDGERTRLVILEIPLVTLRVAAARTVHASSAAARGPQMALAAA
jgi:hypothetical protein